MAIDSHRIQIEDSPPMNGNGVDQMRETVDEVYRLSRAACSRPSSVYSATSTSPKTRCTMRLPRRSNNGRERAFPPIRAPGSSPPAASRRSTHAAAGEIRQVAGRARRATRRRHRGRVRDRDDEGIEDDRLAPDLHLLSPGPCPRCPDRADAARGLRADDRRDRPRVLDHAVHAWPSGSSAPRRRFATRTSRIRSRRPPSCPTAWMPFCMSFIWCSTRGTPPRQASR